MRSLLKPFRQLSFQLMSVCLSASLAQGATLLWDSNGSASPTGLDGAGAWLGTGNWWDASASSNVTWNNGGGDIAVLGNGGTLSSNNYRVSVVQNVTLHGLVFGALNSSNTQAYQVDGSGALNFGAGGFIELRDFSSSTGNLHRINLTNQLQGSDVTIKTVANANLALLTVGGANTWTGSLTLDGSTTTSVHGLFVQFNRASNISSLTQVIVKPVTTAALTEKATYGMNWQLAGAGAGSRGAIRFDSDSTLTGQVELAANTTLTLNTGRSAIISGDITETGGRRRLTISPQSGDLAGRTMTLSGENTFTGGLYLEGGILRLESAGALNRSGTNALVFQANGSHATHERKVVLSGFDIKISELQAAVTANNSVITNDSDTDVTLTIEGTTASTYTGVIQNGAGAGKVSLVKSGSGALTLSGANTYTGLTTVNAGSLNITHSQALGTADGGVHLTSTSASLRLSNNITVVGEHFEGTNLVNVSGTNTWEGGIQTIGGSATTIDVLAGHLTLSSLVEGRSKAQSNHSVNLLGAGTGEVNGVIQNVFQLTKGGSGSWLITGANNYNTPTVISGGNLQVGNASVGRTGTGSVELNNTSAILSGTGQVRGATTVKVGKILSGDGWGAQIGTLTFTSSLALTPNSTSTVAEFTLGNEKAGDTWLIGGNLTISNRALIDVLFLEDYSLNTGDSWTLMDWDGSFSGTNGFNLQQQLNLPDLSLLAGFNQHYWQISDLLSGGALTVTIAAVPEPTKGVLVLVGMVGLLACRRRSH